MLNSIKSNAELEAMVYLYELKINYDEWIRFNKFRLYLGHTGVWKNIKMN